MSDKHFTESFALLVDELAALEHQRWAHWQQYVHEKAERRPDGSLVLPAELVARWQRQIGTRYEDLTNEEKESDREQVWKYLPILKRWLQRVRGEDEGNA
ncbi:MULTISPECIES: hypothetical protein [unclassified Bradyrhizobium]|uniref:hypothetical protein n=1 Tax=unclassified Bradyrhizobium TaxID=2631580 RepID=UPI0029171454|nr:MULTISPECIES: hypothetical protein [unclassified Bradyrhizobium]